MVHVVIKAANGAVDDFRVNCATPQWTVAQLKNYLYRHYPTHPVSVECTYTDTACQCTTLRVSSCARGSYTFVHVRWSGVGHTVMAI